MIDWLNIFFNLFWIVGLAIIVAAFSYSDWQATGQRLKLRQLLKRPSFQLPLSLGLTLISLSLALLTPVWWERLIWLIFVSIFTAQTWQTRQN